MRRDAVKIIRTCNADSNYGYRSFNSRHHGAGHNPPVNWGAFSISDIVDDLEDMTEETERDLSTDFKQNLFMVVNHLESQINLSALTVLC